jgi:hypothetical protein
MTATPTATQFRSHWIPIFFPLSLFFFSLGCLSLLLSFLGDTLTDPSLSSLTPAFIIHSLLSLSLPLPVFSVSSPLWRRSLSPFLFSPLSALVYFALPTLIYFLHLGRRAYCNPRLSFLLLLAEPALVVPSAAKPVIPNDRCKPLSHLLP